MKALSKSLRCEGGFGWVSMSFDGVAIILGSVCKPSGQLNSFRTIRTIKTITMSGIC